MKPMILIQLLLPISETNSAGDRHSDSLLGADEGKESFVSGE